MKKLILFVALFILAGCEEKKDTITVLTSSGYEPYEMIDTNGELTGFDIELMEALAEEIGVEIEWKDVSFEGLIASLQSGQDEIAIAGISPTEERKETLDFSDVYYNTESGLTNFFVYDASSSYTTLSDLEGKVVSAQLGTVQATLLDSVKDEYGFTVDFRSSNAQIVEEIKAGRIDVLVVENIISESILESNPTLTSTGFVSSLDDVSGYAIAFAKDSVYKEQFDAALQTLKDNGTLDALIDKWLK